MQQHPFQVKGARNGLVPDPGYPAGADFASRMRNLRPYEGGARSPEWFTQPFTAPVAWPFPQVYRGEAETLVFAAAGVSVLGADWSTTPVAVKKSTAPGEAATLAGGGVWHAASFEEAWFATNGVDLVFRTPAHAATLRAEGLSVATLCAHGDRLLLAGLSGAWFAGARWQGLFERWRATQPRFSHDQMSWSPRWAVWSDPRGGSSDLPFHALLAMLGVFGDAVFDAFEGEYRKRVERGEIGFSSLRQPGAPMAMAPLGEGVAVYGSEGRAWLLPAGDGGYAVGRDGGAGVVNRGGLSAGAGRHAWIAPTRRLMAQEAGGAVRDLEQAHRFTGDLAGLAASHDPHTGEHWFSTADWAYVLNAHGLGGPMDARPTALCRAGGALVGAGLGLGASDVVVELYSHTTDIGYRGNKTVQVVEVSQRGLSNLTTDVLASSGGEAPFSLGPVQANQYGAGNSKRAGNEFMIGTSGTAPLGGEYAIASLTVRYQADDRRNVRGTRWAAEDS